MPLREDCMTVTFIDYIHVYYTTVSSTPEPPVVTGKFVQIRNKGRLFLVFSPKDFMKYHANIVERFCLDSGMEGSYDPERKRFDILDEAWIIQGGGKFEISRNEKTIRLFDDSMAYGKFDPTDLVKIFKTIPAFFGYRVVTE